MSETPRPPSQRQKRTEVNTGFNNGKPKSVVSAQESPIPDVITESYSIMGEIIQVQTKNGVIHMHKDVLTSTSDFLKTAVHPEWHTDNSIPIDMSDENPVILEAYCQWLYSRNLFVDTLSVGKYTTLARLYVLGEKLLDKTLQEAVLGSMLHNIQAEPLIYPGMKAIKIIYDGTPKGSPARRLMVDFWAYSGNFMWDGPRNPARLRDTDFFEELLPYLYLLRPKPHETITRPWIGSLETYHHATVSERYRVKKEAGDGDEEDIDSADEKEMAMDY